MVTLTTVGFPHHQRSCRESRIRAPSLIRQLSSCFDPPRFNTPETFTLGTHLKLRERVLRRSREQCESLWLGQWTREEEVLVLNIRCSYPCNDSGNVAPSGFNS